MSQLTKANLLSIICEKNSRRFTFNSDGLISVSVICITTLYFLLPLIYCIGPNRPFVIVRKSVVIAAILFVVYRRSSFV